MDFLKQFGKRIKFLRKANGLSQEAFAEKINLHRTSVSRIERGVHFMDIETLEEASKVFNVSYSELFQFGALCLWWVEMLLLQKFLNI